MNEERRHEATDRFDITYRNANGDAGQVPWAEQRPKPLLMDWLEANAVRGDGKRALVVACGLGDDAEELARRGFEVTAFDISPTAIAWAKERFPSTRVDYRVADLYELPADWHGRFDFICEIYTFQSLPPDLRVEAMRITAECVAPGGELVAICRGREPEQPSEGPPYPLSRAEFDTLAKHGLTETDFDDLMDDENPPVRRFRFLFRRTADSHEDGS